MGKRPEPAPPEVTERFDRIRKATHLKRLENARIAVMVQEDEPAFKKGRFNWGRVKKCDPVTQALSGMSNADEYDFVILLPEQSWEFCRQANVLDAYADLLLTRCSVEFEPETKFIPGKNGAEGKDKPIKDVWGRIKYTDQPKFDDDGNPKWAVLPLDLHVLTDNVGRFGPWCEDFEDFSNAAKDALSRGVAKPEPAKAEEVKTETVATETPNVQSEP